MSPAEREPPRRPGMEFLEFLELRRAHNRRGLAQRSERMTALWNRIVDGRGDARALAELESLANTLAGSDATFAFSDLEVGAKALELAMHRLLD
jgi:hypothetical protein